MQKTLVICDACGSDLPSGFVVLNVGGDRAAIVKKYLPESRPSVDLCDDCGESLGRWFAGRSAPEPPQPAPEADPVPAPAVETAPVPEPAPIDHA
jgi:hypothetical protein